MRVQVIVQCQPDLLQVVLALDPPGCLTGLLHRGKQESDQDGNDRDHDQEFNQRKSVSVLAAHLGKVPIKSEKRSFQPERQSPCQRQLPRIPAVSPIHRGSAEDSYTTTGEKITSLSEG